ncbi:NifU family protein [Christensenella intestinihominis]|uniref:NifU family protein n=1 Tax=Christensenella intestinihominis TaxID=1851429 RepID=UPI00082F0E57|nr:NifU family protein [Christensenella intestinihominis]
MSKELLKKIERVLEEKVRPELGGHEGDIEAVSFEDGVLKVRFLGKCSNCPSATLTLESVVASAVREAAPEVREVVLVTGVSDETWSMAKEILKQRREQRENRD